MGVLGTLLDQLRRRLLGVSPEELRYTIADVRNELRATREELKTEIAALRREVEASHRGGEDRVKGPELPVAEA
jgi:hypothetical protein